jgi:hypothetical protein
MDLSAASEAGTHAQHLSQNLGEHKFRQKLAKPVRTLKAVLLQRPTGISKSKSAAQNRLDRNEFAAHITPPP